jgi:hypothetical protein
MAETESTRLRDVTPRLLNGAERCVYHTLTDQLQPNDVVIPNQRVTDHLKDHEVDFVVANCRETLTQGAGRVVSSGSCTRPNNADCVTR